MRAVTMRVQRETCSTAAQLGLFGGLGLGAHVGQRRLQHLDLHIVGDLDQDFRIVGLAGLDHLAQDAARGHHRVAAAQIVHHLLRCFLRCCCGRISRKYMIAMMKMSGAIAVKLPCRA